MNGYILFSDLKGFSRLSEPEIAQYYNEVLPGLRDKIVKYSELSKVWNTWGDAIIAVFDNGKDACDYAITLRNYFATNHFAIEKNMVPRIGGHFGEFAIITDPLTNNKNAFGKNINTTSRIEPVTRPGEVFVSESFKRAIENLPTKNDSIKFDPLGCIQLAKNFGELELFRLYSTGEKEQVIDRIYKEDLAWALPIPPEMRENEKATINYYNASPSKEVLLDTLPKVVNEENSGAFIFELVRVCKNFGLYEKSLEYAECLEKWKMNAGELFIYPYAHDVELQKIKVNSLTRLSKYEPAANIIYNLWKSGQQDSDTLAMLAAQYKRRAIMKDNQVVSEDQINKELLSRSIMLYIGAFRLNINDYYPAINAAYLYKIIGGMETGRGTKLARYICDAWGNRQGENWWIDATLAEAELLQDDYETATNMFTKALDLHNPSIFEKQSTKEQLFIYSTIKMLDKEFKIILELLES